MSDCAFYDLPCKAAEVVHNQFERIVQDTADWAADMILWSMTWWITTDTIDPNSLAVRDAQSYTAPLIALILMCSVLAQSIRIVLQRKLQPLLDLASGVARYVLVTTTGLILLGAAVAAGDAFSQWALDSAMRDFHDKLAFALDISGGDNVVGVLIISLILGFLSLIQWLLGFIRQAGILVLAVMLPLAAAGSLSQTGKEWLSKLLPWLFALVAYKPMAALIYVTGFELFGTTEPIAQTNGWQTALVGVMILLLALIAMPALMKFFSWANVSVPNGGAGGALGSAVGQVAGGAASRSDGQRQSSYMDATGPQTGPNGAQQGQQGTTPTGPSGNTDPPDPPDPNSGPPPPPPAPQPTAAGGQQAGAAQGGQQAAAAGSSGQAAAGAGAAGAGAAGAAVTAGKQAYDGVQQTAGQMGEQPQ